LNPAEYDSKHVNAIHNTARFGSSSKDWLEKICDANELVCRLVWYGSEIIFGKHPGAIL